ncbi:class II fructose-bisphosphate aldolase (plasmid) [Klebsiella pneumoniae]|nr:class II fructose-bisphosphate aldolase [Klebsiella pneumoniae]
MYDGSHLPFKENILKTKAVVQYAHAHGVSVEESWNNRRYRRRNHVAEMTRYIQDRKTQLKFVKLSGVDALKIAIGLSRIMEIQKQK